MLAVTSYTKLWLFVRSSKLPLTFDFKTPSDISVTSFWKLTCTFCSFIYLFHFSLIAYKLLKLNRQGKTTFSLLKKSFIIVHRLLLWKLIHCIFFFYPKLTSVVWLVHFLMNLKHMSAKWAEDNCLRIRFTSCGLED